jgi:hypothetical protein
MQRTIHHPDSDQQPPELDTRIGGFVTTPRPERHRIGSGEINEQPEMDCYPLRLPRWLSVQAFRPLARRSDRVERLVFLLAVVVTILAVPIAAAIGTEVYDSRRHIYAEQARSYDSVTAIVTDNPARPDSRRNTIAVSAQWYAAGLEHTGSLRVPPTVKPGDSIQILVNENGSLVDTPMSTGRAAMDGVTVAAAIWFGAAGGAALIVVGVRLVLARVRDAGWQHDIEILLVGNDGDDSRH